MNTKEVMYYGNIESIKDSYLMPEKGMIATWVGSLLKP